MLTLELLNQTDGLKDLTPEAKAKIVEASKNDENQVMAKKLGETHGMYQTDIESTLGITKPEGWKSSKGTSHTYEWLKESVLPTLKTNSDTSKLTTELAELKKANGELEEQLKTGKLDEASKKKISDLETKITDHETTIQKLRDDTTTSTADWEKKVKEESDKNMSYRIDSKLNTALAGKAYKAGIPEEAIAATVATAKQAILAKGTPEILERENGEFDVVFRGADGLVIANPENLQKPFTASELLLKQLTPILDAGRKQSGGGGGAGGGNPQPVILDLSGVTNRVDADSTIRKYVAAQGTAAGSKEFQEQYNQIFNDNKVADLPMKSD